MQTPKIPDADPERGDRSQQGKGQQAGQVTFKEKISPHFTSCNAWMVVEKEASGGILRRWPEGTVSPGEPLATPARGKARTPTPLFLTPGSSDAGSASQSCPPSDVTRSEAQRAPATPPLLYQTWESLLFLHWALPPGYLQSSLPKGLTVDTYQDQAWLGIVPFTMRGVRPRFFPAVPGISNFLELNVRTYVYDETGTPGVWFFSLDADSPLAVYLARSFFHLAYRHAKITSSHGEWSEYSARRIHESEQAHYRFRPTGPTRTSDPGTLEFFLLERYVLFAQSKSSTPLYRGRVHHSPYQIQDVELDASSSLPLRWNGQSQVEGPPHHACFSPRVKVSVHGLEQVLVPGNPQHPSAK